VGWLLLQGDGCVWVALASMQRDDVVWDVVGVLGEHCTLVCVVCVLCGRR
jgi:hypothetical protein